VRGNPQLEPERGWSADLGASFAVSGRRAQLALDGALFATRSTNLIHFQERGYFASYLNVAAARVLGAELSAAASFRRHLRLYAQGTFTDARDRSGIASAEGKQLPHRPRLRAYARPELRALPVGRRAAVGLYADVDVTGARPEDPANLVRLRRRLVFGAGASVAWRPAGVRAVVSAYNLGNAAGGDVLEYPLPGRSVFVTLHVSSPAHPAAPPGQAPEKEMIE
jgi:iron complex outermembrane receptor protein